MLKLIFRDLFIYQRRNLIILPLFAVLFTFFIGQSPGPEGFTLALIIIAPFALTMTAYTAFAYDEASKFNRFLRATPATPETIVLSRYAACLLSAVSGAVFVMLFAAIANAAAVYYPVLQRDIALGMDVFMTWVIVLALYCAVLMPILFKFGYMKTKYPLMMMFIALSAGGPMILSSTGINRVLIGVLSSVSMTGGYIIFFIVSLLALYGSAKLSISIFRKKEE